MKRRRVTDFLWRHATVLGLGALVLFLGGLGFSAYTYLVVTRKFESSRKWDLPSRIYSDATPIVPGQAIPRSVLEPKLNYLGYHEVEGTIDQPGEYRYTEDDLEIYLQDFRYPDIDFHGMPVKVEMSGNVVRRITRMDDGSTVRGVRLEPELITSIFDEVMEDRLPVPIESVPQHVVDAIVATEDRAFFEHEGVSLRGITRAAFTDLKKGTLHAGGSTLTQQLVKNFYLNPERTFRRKAIEAVMAVVLEARYSKNEILEAYLNEIYLGQNGSVQIVGVEQASQAYFGKRVNNLDLSEAATLAGIIRSPNYYSPLRHPDRATERRNVILGVMRDIGKIDGTRYAAAIAAPMTVNKYPRAIRSAPYFVDLVLKELRETYPETQLTSEGLRIFTTLDAMMQREAETSLNQGIESLRDRYARLKRKEESPEGAILTIQPGTGYVKVLVGGRDYRRSQFNRVFQARRQPGSLFKPFVYAAAMDPSREGEPLTAASILNDSPITVETGKDQWQPRNYDNTFHGLVSVRTALMESYNIPAVRAAIDAGMDNVIQMASKIGVESRLEPYPSISLGSFEVTPLEIAFAYSVFANGGVRSAPVTILAVATRDGKVLENRVVEMNRVAPAGVCYVINDILRDVIREGTGSGVRALGFRGDFAGKTGTTNDYRDAWFVGYSPSILSLVWVGYDDNSSLGLSGSSGAVPIWADYMKRISGLISESEFRRPEDIVEREIDPTTGFLTAPFCPGKRMEVFVAGTEPSEICPYHERWDPYIQFGVPLYDEQGRLLSPEEVEESRLEAVRRRDGRLRRWLRDIFD